MDRMDLMDLMDGMDGEGFRCDRIFVVEAEGGALNGWQAIGRAKVFAAFFNYFAAEVWIREAWIFCSDACPEAGDFVVELAFGDVSLGRKVVEAMVECVVEIGEKDYLLAGYEWSVWNLWHLAPNAIRRS